MQTFIDTKTQQIYAFEDDVAVAQVKEIYKFTAANGSVLSVPETLQPYTVPEFTAAELLAQAQGFQIAIIKQSCQNAIYTGFSSSALGVPHTYPAKATDQLNLNGSVTASLLPSLPAGWTTPFWCEDSAGNWAYVEHTAEQIQRVGSDGKAAILANIIKCQSYIEQIQTATTVAAVKAVVWQ